MPQENQGNIKPPNWVEPAGDYRESLGTMDEKGKRIWVYPKKPKGKYYTKRTFVSYFLLLFFFGIPILNYYRVEQGMNPFLQFNFIKRQFYVFGNFFQPQDFEIFAIGIIISIIFITVFTVIWGRLFCGWICPQTIFLEMVFRKIEFLIDGDRNKQMKLSRQSWDAEKIRKRTLKYTLYILLSVLIAFFFLAYIVGSQTVFNLLHEGIAENVDTFIGVFVFAGIFFFVFSWFREQACTLVCPYGRLQGVLVDKKTVTVAYDYVRGEGTAGRSSWRNGEDRKAAGKGDCIDCKQCVYVCPTGIDIRNSANQLECINCTACMDACDEIMEKINFPKGLIRYASEENISEGTQFKVSPRAWAYTLVIIILLIVFNIILLNRSSVESTFVRKRGADLIVTDSTFTNPYNYMLSNKTNDTIRAQFQIIEPKASIQYIGHKDPIVIPPHEIVKGSINVIMPIEEYQGTNSEIKIGVFNLQDQLIDTYKITFRGPISTL